MRSFLGSHSSLGRVGESFTGSCAACSASAGRDVGSAAPWGTEALLWHDCSPMGGLHREKCAAGGSKIGPACSCCSAFPQLSSARLKVVDICPGEGILMILKRC